MTTKEIMTELEGYGSESIKNVLIKHGAREPFFGVKVQDLKKIVKKVKKNHELSLELYATGNTDAMYLAGLIADEKLMTKEILIDWADGAYWSYISEWTVPWITAESDFAMELALEWIEADEERFEVAGWATLSSYAGLNDDEKLDVKMYSDLLDRIEKTIHEQKNRVRHIMNAFVIAIGSCIAELTDKAIKVGSTIGKVEVHMGGTACKTPSIPVYIQKVKDRGSIGKKRKSARC